MFVLLGVIGASVGFGLAGCGGSDATTGTTSTSSSSSGMMDAGPDGLPCDVADVLDRRCRLCHSDPPTHDVPMALVTYADLMKPSKKKPDLKRIEYAVERVQSATDQMPPLPSDPLDAKDIAVLAAWLKDGLPKGDCAPKHGPYDGPPVCTTNEHWTQGNATQPLPGELMHPGMPCVGCHQQMNAKGIELGGTVFATGREPDDCDGVNDGTVEITDAMGQVLMLPINANGNFYYPSATGTVAFPLRARILYQGREGLMGAEIKSGDCNACHTPYGEHGAPGRLILP